MRVRSELCTACGGTVLGMSMPLFALGLLLQLAPAALLGLDPRAIDLSLSVIAAMSSLMLFMSGSFLLWGDLLEPVARREVSRAAPARPQATQVTRPMARPFAAARRGVALDMRRVAHRPSPMSRPVAAAKRPFARA